MFLVISSLMMVINLNAHGKNSQEIDIPEPLLFDLVRAINAKKGELEFNVLKIHTDAQEIKGCRNST
jgi:hypothetical protein